jgi:hypothetical protein
MACRTRLRNSFCPESSPNSGAAEQPTTRPTEPVKRITVDVPAILHQRVKIGCAQRQLNISEVLRDFLEREFPPQNRK